MQPEDITRIWNEEHNNFIRRQCKWNNFGLILAVVLYGATLVYLWMAK